jgi:hypothetical protein
MTFDEVVAQTLELLQRQGRVSYRALKRRFELKDEYLADLKEELLFSFPQVRDEEERGLNQTTRQWYTQAASCEVASGEVAAARSAWTAAVTSGV